MDADQLREVRFMADLPLDEFARRLKVPAEQLAEMEEGSREIPEALADEIFFVADRAIRDMGYP